MKRNTKMSILSFAFAAACLMGCNQPIETEPETVYSNPEIVYPDTSIFRPFQEIQKVGKKFQTIEQLVVGSQPYTPKAIPLHGVPLNLGFLKKVKGNPLNPKVKYLAVGSSLTAGVRDGGYFNEGMLTSYPNIIARQLGIADLKMPLFDPQDYNGTGRKIPTDFNPSGGPFQKFNISSNNLGIQGFEQSMEDVYDQTTGSTVKKPVERPLLKKYRGHMEDLDVVAFPGLIMELFEFNTSKPSKLFEARVASRGGKAPFSALMEKDADIFTIELGSQGFVPNVPEIGGGPNGYEHPMTKFIKKQLAAGAKGCISNIPDYSKFPVYHQVTFAEMKKATFNTPIQFPFEDLTNICFVPNGKLDSLMSPKVNIALKNLYLEAFSDVFSGNIRSNSINTTNGAFFDYILKDIDIPIVDLYNLYEKILAGNYTTHDGNLVDPSYPKGNFFSNDGLYPTPFGNAVIANEFIRTLNKHYKLAIPLVPTSAYLNQ
ncbi:hypothetical protein LAG90_14280 [Marinilongibacter aquaticus]|uniref:hypothetical protein n=1 Tax=Marinilongibacter aquaticus TaxID=2975157 RepID=UPI0021BD5E74|nr:hypothetical protein [Marinilongibacter aquaticus]UBM57973.1 hypothetical protein LAG90_14280 [Marinilongibacter aquaticus]